MTTSGDLVNQALRDAVEARRTRGRRTTQDKETPPGGAEEPPRRWVNRGAGEGNRPENQLEAKVGGNAFMAALLGRGSRGG